MRGGLSQRDGCESSSYLMLTVAPRQQASSSRRPLRRRAPEVSERPSWPPAFTGWGGARCVGSGRARVQVTTRSRKSGVLGSNTQGGQEVELVSRWLLWGARFGGLTWGCCSSAFVSLVFCSTAFTCVDFCSEVSNCHGAHIQEVRRRMWAVLLHCTRTSPACAQLRGCTWCNAFAA